MVWIIGFAAFLTAILSGVLVFLFWGVRQRSNENIPMMIWLIIVFIYSTILIVFLIQSSQVANIYLDWLGENTITFNTLGVLAQMFMGIALLLFANKAEGRFPEWIFYGAGVLEVGLSTAVIIGLGNLL